MPEVSLDGWTTQIENQVLKVDIYSRAVQGLCLDGNEGQIQAVTILTEAILKKDFMLAKRNKLQ